MRILVIGTGSIGRRHINNLLKIGAEVFCYDRDMPLLEKTINEYNIKAYDFRSHHLQMDAYVICVPPNYHTPFMFEALDHNAHIFVEKPISNNLDRLDELIKNVKQQKRVLMVGYQLRYNNGLRYIKEIIDSEELGRILTIRAEYGNYLPNWHKEDYHKLYTGHKNEGGGIILDASHEIDYCNWLVGKPVIEVKSMMAKLSSLDIDVEDTADILLRFDNDSIANIHLDMIDKEYKRKCTIVLEKGTIHWNITSNFPVIVNGQPKYFEKDDEYVLEMIDFIDRVNGKLIPESDKDLSLETLKICLQALNR